MNEEAELLQSLIRNSCINDGSNNPEEIRNADMLLSVIEPTAATVDVVDAAPGRRSLIARWPGTDPSAPTLMLLGHTDVVPADATRWERDPFAAEVHDGFIWGRGSMDMLGHIATMTLAFRDLVTRGRHLPGDVVLAAVADEEALSGMGMEFLMREHSDLLAADWVLSESGGVRSGPSHEPKLNVLIAEKGAWRVAVEITAQPGHSSMPFGSESALGLAAEVVAKLGEADGLIRISDDWREVVRRGWDPRAWEVITDPERIDAVVARLPIPGARAVHGLTRMTVVPTRITTDGSWNSMSAKAVIELDVRTVAGQEWDDIAEYVHRVVGPDLSERIHLRTIAYANASRTAIDTELWQLLERSARAIVPSASLVPAIATGVTDARFMRQQGATAYGFGLYSPRIEAAEVPMMLHGDNERVDVESLALMRELWSTVFLGLAERPPHER